MNGPILMLLLVLLASLFSILLLNLLAQRAWSKGEPDSWAIVRQVIGWRCVVVGLLLFILPGPGIPLLIIGVLLVGR